MIEKSHQIFYNHNASAEIAQLVEQVIRNDQVVGSSPIFGTIAL
jgi:hypothetical protein